VCRARTPRCDVCILADLCPSAQIPVQRPVPGHRGARAAPAGRGSRP
jgi:hypothetical protein